MAEGGGAYLLHYRHWIVLMDISTTAFCKFCRTVGGVQIDDCDLIAKGDAFQTLSQLRGLVAGDNHEKLIGGVSPVVCDAKSFIASCPSLPSGNRSILSLQFFLVFLTKSTLPISFHGISSRATENPIVVSI